MRLLLASALAACGPPPVSAPRTCPARATLAAPEDVAALADCTQVDALTIRTAGDLDLAPLAKLVTITGDLTVGPSVGLAELALPALATVGEIRIVSNNDLRGLYLRGLERARAIAIDNNVTLQTVSLPRLDTVDKLHVGEAAVSLLRSIISSAAGELAIDDAPELALVEVGAPRVQTVRLGNVPKLAPDAADKLRGLVP